MDCEDFPCCGHAYATDEDTYTDRTESAAFDWADEESAEDTDEEEAEEEAEENDPEDIDADGWLGADAWLDDVDAWA